MHVLARMQGVRTTNGMVSLRQPFRREVLGDEIYIVIRGKMEEKPKFSGAAVALDPPARVLRRLDLSHPGFAPAGPFRIDLRYHPIPAVVH